jgi:hypothetical protein
VEVCGRGRADRNSATTVQESLHDKHHLMGTKARPGAMSRTTRDGRSMDEHLRDSLRRMTHDPPDQPLVRLRPFGS